ncbi:MAG TPA: endonuclease, partial [Dehalococcoidales bacterium]|nr:endonuclease [Dehalococcoidales bacterium]
MDGQRVSEVLPEVYRRLMDRYGPQRWWPAQSPFEVIVGAILTQSAAWTNVARAITSLRDAGRLSPAGLRSLPEDELARLIYSCGYYNVKARKLKAFVGWLGEEYRDDLDALLAVDTGVLRRQLLGIYGIGEETADSILLYAAGKPSFVIDAYTRRIVGRLGLDTGSSTYAAFQALFTDNLPADVSLYNEYH